MSRRRKLAVVAAALAVAAAAVLLAVRTRPHIPTAPPPPADIRAASFERDPAWEGLNNRRLGQCTTTRQDFGAREAAGRPSVGGTVTRAEQPAWFGRPVALDFEHPFTATGELTVHGAAVEDFPSGSAIVGFFNHANRDWRPPDVVAFQIGTDPVDGGGDYSVQLLYGARDYRADYSVYGGDEHPTGFRFGQTYRWQLSYDPSGGGGQGTVTLSFPDVGPPVTLALNPDARGAGAVLDRFGLANQTTARGDAVDIDLTDLALDGRPLEPGAGWEGHDNRTAYRDCLTGRPNSFGWTGKDDRRVGGLISRTDEDRPELRAFYADRIQRLSLDDRLHMEGTVELERANSDSATLLGWFRAGSTGEGEAEAAPADFIGIAITGPSEIGQYFSALVSDSDGTVERADDELGLVLNPGPSVHRWSFDFYPHSGKAGVIVVRLDDRRVAWSVPAKLRHDGASFNRFGLRNLERGGSFQVVYFDDLRYTFRGPDSLRRPRDEPGDDDSNGKDKDDSRDGRPDKSDMGGKSRKHDRSRKRDRHD